MAKEQQSYKMVTPNLRIGFVQKELSYFDPSKIANDVQYVFLENIYSPLVELDNAGQIIPGLASSWTIDDKDNSTITFTMRKDIGVSARDAEVSIKRLIILSSNSHGNLSEMLMCDKNMKKLDDHCEGIRSNGDKLILKLKKWNPFLIPMLSAIDFAVIPESAIDKNTLAINDYTITSGPYSVDGTQLKDGTIKLKANKNNHHYSTSVPQSITLIPTNIPNSPNSVEMLNENKIDLILSVDPTTNLREIISLSNSSKEISDTFYTENMQLGFLSFTRKGMKLPFDTRLKIAKTVKQYFKEHLTNVFDSKFKYSFTDTFFPSFSNLGLSETDEVKVSSLYQRSNEKVNLPHPLRIRLCSGRIRKYKDAYYGLEKVLNIKIEEGNPSAFSNESIDEMPEIEIRSTDIGFDEDISLISYMTTSETFDLSREESKKWMEQFTNEPSKEIRLRMLRELHKETLLKVKGVPLIIFPYAAIARNGWKIHFSKLYANNKFWQLSHE